MSSFKPELTNIRTENSELRFTLSGSEGYGLDKSMANAIRRTLLTDIPTVAFRIDENVSNKDIKINTNTGSLHNELLLQRIGLLPIYLNPNSYMKNYLFKLKVQSDDVKRFSFITAENFEIYPLKPELQKRVDSILTEENLSELDEILNSNNYENYDLNNPISEKEKEKIFRPYVFKRNKSKNYCLITELKNTNSEQYKQEIDLYGTPSLSTAEENSRFQAVSCSTYSFTIDENLVKKVWSDKVSLEKYTPEEEKDKFHKFYLEESERYYYRDSENEPYKYNFHIKSCHYMNEKDLLISSMQILIDRLDNLKSSFVNLLQDKESCISVDKMNDILYHYSINNEGHTIGNLIQSHIVRRCISEECVLSFCGYKKTHPLENIIKLIVSINPNHKIIEETEQNKFQKITIFLMEEIETIKSDFKVLIKECEKSL
jgi:DNA-directed RNA polymerase subunit L